MPIEVRLAILSYKTLTPFPALVHHQRRKFRPQPSAYVVTRSISEADFAASML